MSKINELAATPMIEKLTIREVAGLMGVCDRTVTNWRKQGLRCVKIGRKCWILIADLRAFIEAHRGGQGV